MKFYNKFHFSWRVVEPARGTRCHADRHSILPPTLSEEFQLVPIRDNRFVSVYHEHVYLNHWISLRAYFLFDIT